MLHAQEIARRRAWVAPLLLLAGCAAGGLVNMWRDPDYPRQPLHRIFVVVVKRDPAQRRLMEESFVDALARHGVDATPSYRQFPTSLPDTAQIFDAVHDGSFDGVLVTSRLDTRTVERYVPGYVTTRTYLGWNRWLGRYQTYYADVDEPGYVEAERVVRHRVDLWSTENDGEMVWTATSNSIDPSSANQVNREVVERVVHELVDQRIIPK